MKKLLILSVGLLLLSGCNLILERAAAQYSVVIEPETLTITAGEEENITVDISPLSGIELGIATTTITLDEAPEGVTISPEKIEIGTGSKAKTITIIVAQDAPPIEDGVLSLEAIREGLTQYGELKLSITAAE